MATIENTDDLQDNEEKKILKKKLNTEFPLSGGETDAEWSSVIHSTQEETEEEIEEKHKFKHKLDVDFPLSGGGEPV